jgi:hypothetical protein
VWLLIGRCLDDDRHAGSDAEPQVTQQRAAGADEPDLDVPLLSEESGVKQERDPWRGDDIDAAHLHPYRDDAGHADGGQQPLLQCGRVLVRPGQMNAARVGQDGRHGDASCAVNRGTSAPTLKRRRIRRNIRVTLEAFE